MRTTNTPFRGRPGETSPGYILSFIVLVLLVAAIFVPLVFQLTSNESRAGVRYLGSSKAMAVAEMGLAGVESRLKEEFAFWVQALSTTPVAGYADDVEYADSPYGAYKVRLSTGPVDGQVRVIVNGRDANTGEVRSVEAVYTKTFDPGNAAVRLDDGTLQINSPIHWGSIVHHVSIATLYPTIGSGMFGFPKKYSAGVIDIASNPPYTDQVEAFGMLKGLGEAPELDMDYYKARAKASSFPITTYDALGTPMGEMKFMYLGNAGIRTPVATPAGSGYFLNDGSGIYPPTPIRSRTYYLRRAALSVNPNDIFEFRSSTSVVMFSTPTHGGLWLQRAFLEVEAVIFERFDGSLGSFLDNPGLATPFSVPIPEGADAQYQSAAGSAYWLANFEGVYNQPDHCCFTLANPVFHGFIAAKGLSILGTPVYPIPFLGSLHVGGGSSLINAPLYFDPEVATKVKYLSKPNSMGDASLTRVSWREIPGSWE